MLGPVVAAEGAERAVLDADVGEVDVAVDHVGHHVARLPSPHLIGDQRQSLEVATARLQELDAVVHRELAAVQHGPENAAALG